MSDKMMKKEEKMLELYVHIPFCVRKCLYCDFLSFPAGGEEKDLIRSYCHALEKEIRASGNTSWLVKSIFFGGGTPSLLGGDQMAALMETIRHYFRVDPEAEISLEANPGTLDRDRLKEYYKAGFNRLSIGLQSASDQALAVLGRIHSLDQFLENYQEARRCGFDNINIDIMSGLPGQSLEDYIKTLDLVTDLRPEHISSYSLIVEEGTPLSRSERLLDLLPDEETDRRMYQETGRRLEKAGYQRYEISNYALPGKECRHNLGYWSGIPYLGLGLGASSYLPVEGGGHCRFKNTDGMTTYLERPFLPFEDRQDYAVLTREEEMEEYMFLGLRKREGVSVAAFARSFGRTMEEVYGSRIRAYRQSGHLLLQGDRLSLTEKGIDVSDYLFRDFMLVD